MTDRILFSGGVEVEGEGRRGWLGRRLNKNGPHRSKECTWSAATVRGRSPARGSAHLRTARVDLVFAHRKTARTQPLLLEEGSLYASMRYSVLQLANSTSGSFFFFMICFAFRCKDSFVDNCLE